MYVTELYRGTHLNSILIICNLRKILSLDVNLCRLILVDMALIRDDDVSTNDEVQYCDSLVVCARDCVAAIQLVLSSKLIQLELPYQTLHMFDALMSQPGSV